VSGGALVLADYRITEPLLGECGMLRSNVGGDHEGAQQAFDRSLEITGVCRRSRQRVSLPQVQIGVESAQLRNLQESSGLS